MFTRRSGRRAAAAGIVGGVVLLMPILGNLLTDAFGADRVGSNVPLAPLTTFKVGGPAEWLVSLHRPDDVRYAIEIARETGIPVTALGGGSNVLVADTGVRGLVVRLHGGDVSAVSASLVRADA